MKNHFSIVQKKPFSLGDGCVPGVHSQLDRDRNATTEICVYVFDGAFASSGRTILVGRRNGFAKKNIGNPAAGQHGLMRGEGAR